MIQAFLNHWSWSRSPQRNVNSFLQLQENMSHVVGQNSSTPWGNNNLTFRLACDQVVLLETAANLWASWPQANDFLAVFCIFELGGITKHSMTGSVGNGDFCFPLTSMFPSALPWGSTLRVLGKQNSLFPLGPAIKCFVTFLNSKREQIAKHPFAWRWLAHKFAAVSRCTKKRVESLICFLR